MATYAIGDVQGCFAALQKLLQKIRFDDKHDTLWFVGDIVNRGPQSLETLRFVKDLGQNAVTVLGNHDLHLLAVAHGVTHQRKPDTMDPILAAPDRDELMDWIRHQALLHYDPDLNAVMVHAGISPMWDLQQAIDNAREMESVFRGDDYVDFLNVMYGNTPDNWRDDLEGVERLRYITNSFTRMRYCYEDGRLNMDQKGPPGSQAPGLMPWYALTTRKPIAADIIFGHWSTLGNPGFEKIFALDTGCLWGGKLSAMEVGTKQITQIKCAMEKKPG
ncbi:MAG: symmetrical bis(5'-nucleosyl)-tetraphosphatase [Gammaproteobacteria bacterium]|nr:symmetrical bis(5'-nucleosyl)-tetraphosphatase [Gammaproteobacteria bacterium]